jgi:hypothetical protein
MRLWLPQPGSGETGGWGFLFRDGKRRDIITRYQPFRYNLFQLRVRPQRRSGCWASQVRRSFPSLTSYRLRSTKCGPSIRQRHPEGLPRHSKSLRIFLSSGSDGSFPTKTQPISSAVSRDYEKPTFQRRHAIVFVHGMKPPQLRSLSFPRLAHFVSPVIQQFGSDRSESGHRAEVAGRSKMTLLGNGGCVARSSLRLIRVEARSTVRLRGR